MLEVIKNLFILFWQMFRFFLNPFFLIPTGVIILIYIKKYRDYKSGAYYQITKAPFISLWRDLGRYGEYLTYKRLKSFENDGAKFLFNVYIPKEDGKTTEIDVLMINKKGIFVFESKNYSGWIFGNEKQNNWYQTLPKGRGKSHKEHFYNPIMQNRSHIKHLKAYVGEQILMHSIIVFSERCTLKNVTVKSNDIYVIKRDQVSFVVSNVCKSITEDVLTENDITNFYNKLYPYTQISNAEKAQHIENIQNIQNKLMMKRAITPDETATDVKNKVEKTDDMEPDSSASVTNETNEIQKFELDDANPLESNQEKCIDIFRK